MNVYIIVEGSRTEMSVYPEWLKILVPGLDRVDSPFDIKENNYYIFDGGGIPSIYNHVANAVEDINRINAEGSIKIDYLLVCIDTEEESRGYIMAQIERCLAQKDGLYFSFRLEVFEHKVCMESWFLGNRKMYKSNPDDSELKRYTGHYNVKENDPEFMGNIDEDEFSTRAQFHHAYLKKLFKERNMKYSKSKPEAVCQKPYLDMIIDRYEQTGHLQSFGRWYSFVKTRLG